MNVYYITGTSRGLGRALAEELLKNDDNLVIGIGRKCEIEHPNYKHKRMDLSDTTEVSKFRFGEHLKARRTVLINNAGTLGDIKYLGDLDNKAVLEALHTNLTSPFILTNNFIKAYKTQSEVEQIVLNISSGASVSAYDGWGLYCTSKAGINMMSNVLQLEAQQRNRSNVKVLSIAPGIIETTMQEQIRATHSDDFSMVDKFVDLKESNDLQSPDQTAKQLLELLESSTPDMPVFQDLRKQ